jgi:hypothetical protein
VDQACETKGGRDTKCDRGGNKRANEKGSGGLGTLVVMMRDISMPKLILLIALLLWLKCEGEMAGMFGFE